VSGAGPVLRSSTALYDSLALTYDEHYRVPHRRAYDDLSWTFCTAALPPPPAVVVDLGCGVGRWAQRLLSSGYTVVGIEPSPRMAEQAAARLSRWSGAAFTLVPVPVEEVELAPGSVDAVLAIGSLQYTDDPAATLRRVAHWMRPGAALCVLVDSLNALVLELLAEGRQTEAVERLTSRRGTWCVAGVEADLHLFDQAALRSVVVDAGIDVVQGAGLLVGASAYGREELNRKLLADYDGTLAAERALAHVPAVADLGKQLLMVGRRAARPTR
jgi:Methylase involved in ubiquinone/menaquinone biosynthesis